MDLYFEKALRNLSVGYAYSNQEEGDGTGARLD